MKDRTLAIIGFAGFFVWLCFVVAILWVAAHFIIKFW